MQDEQTNGSRVDQALRLWASQNDPLMDLGCMASEWISGVGGSVPKCEQFAIHFKAEAKKSPAELIALRTKPWMDVGLINTVLLHQESRGIRSGRRAWVQALSLAGCIDFGASWDDAPKGFNHIAGLAACWYWTRSPLINEQMRQAGKRPLVVRSAKTVTNYVIIFIARLSILALFVAKKTNKSFVSILLKRSTRRQDG